MPHHRHQHPPKWQVHPLNVAVVAVVAVVVDVVPAGWTEVEKEEWTVEPSRVSVVAVKMDNLPVDIVGANVAVVAACRADAHNHHPVASVAAVVVGGR